MSPGRLLTWVGLVCVTLALPGVAAATPRATIGSSMGLTYLDYGEDASTTVVGTSNTGSFMPGLSVGVISREHRWGARIDFGVVSMSAGDAGSVLGGGLTVNAVYDLKPGRSTSPYVTGGGGPYYDRLVQVSHVYSDTYRATFSSTRVSFGAGVGVRHDVSAGHGRIRAEARYDRLTEGHDSRAFPAATVLGLRLGYDLVFGP